MGREKAGLRIDGEMLLARCARAARGAGLEVIAVGRVSPETRREVESAGLVSRWVDDEQPGEGPLAALGTALREVGGDVILSACDMPLLDVRAFAWLAGFDDSRDVVPMNNGRLEPLFARYGHGLLGAIEARLAAGERSLRGLIEGGSFTIVDAPEWLRVRLVNVNTPGDLEAILRRGGGSRRGRGG